MENIIDYFINLYQQSQDLSSTRKQILQNDLRNLIAKLNMINQLGIQAGYTFLSLQNFNFENVFLAPKSLNDLRNLIDISVDQLINNFNDLKAYQSIISDLEKRILKLI